MRVPISRTQNRIKITSYSIGSTTGSAHTVFIYIRDKQHLSKMQIAQRR